MTAMVLYLMMSGRLEKAIAPCRTRIMVDFVAVLFPLVLQETRLRRILFVAPSALMGVRRDAANAFGKGGIVQDAHGMGIANTAFLARRLRQLAARMILLNVRLSLRVAFVHFVAVRAIVAALRLQNRQIQFGHRVDANVRMLFGHVIDEHAATLEAQHAIVAFVNESLIVGGCDSRSKFDTFRCVNGVCFWMRRPMRVGDLFVCSGTIQFKCT